MAELNSRIKPKKSSVSGEVPQAADLEVAELAVNTADGKLFVKHTDNTIKEISGSGGGGGGAVDSVNGQTGDVSLGIQDMDDAGYTGPGTPVVFADGSTTDTHPSIGAVRLQGFEGYDQPGDQAYFAINLAQPGFEQVAVGDEITVDPDNWIPLTPQVIESIEEVETYPGSGVLASIRYNVPALWDIPRNSMLNADEVTITPSSRKEQDGDVLTWVESIGKYVPAPPTGGGSYVKLSTLKAEVAASTDFADFQSRIAAL